MSRAPKHIALIAIVGLSALLAACSSDDSNSNSPGGGGKGGGSAGSGSTSLPNPCTLFDAAELEAINGVTIDESKTELSSGASPVCTWFDEDDFSSFTTQLHANSSIFDASKTALNRPTIPGLGADAYLGQNGDIWVKMPNGITFMAQSLKPVADKKISDVIKTAASAETMDSQLVYEAGYRLAKLEVDRL